MDGVARSAIPVRSCAQRMRILRDSGRAASVYSGRTMPTTSHLDKLNGPQRKAVTYGEPLPDNKGFKAGPLLIVAGAGTGKTDTLAHRVAHLVIHGVDPGRILMLTFTRR